VKKPATIRHRGAVAKKTAKKARKTTARTTAPAKVPQPHGGALNTGGTPGNVGGQPGRSGRKPDEFREFCRATLDGAKVAAAARAIAEDKDHPQWRSAVEWLSKYGYHELVNEKTIRLEGVNNAQAAYETIKARIRATLAPDAAAGLIDAITNDLRSFTYE
jgi:hypothetical protein